MQAIFSVFTVALMVGLIGLALTFGMALLLWFMLFAFVVSLFVMARQFWYRLRYGKPMPQENTTPAGITVIEVDYKDITHHK